MEKSGAVLIRQLLGCPLPRGSLGVHFIAYLARRLFCLFQKFRQRGVQLESADGGVGQLESDNCNTASNLLFASLNLLVSCSMS